MKIQKGQVIAFTTGEYSDYCLRDHMRALCDFETADKIAEFKAIEECRTANCWDLDCVFMAWLVKTGVVEPSGDEVIEWHVGSYGALTP